MRRACLVSALFALSCGALAPDAGDASDGAVCLQTTPQQIAESTLSFGTITAFAIHGTDIVWTEDDGTSLLRRAPKAGGAATTLASCDYLALDGDVAFCISTPTSATTPTTLLRVPLDGSPVATVATVSPTAYRPLAAAGRLYFVDASTIWTVDETGGTPTAFASGPNVALLMIDHDVVYWTSDSGGYDAPNVSLNATSTTSGATTTLTTSSAYIQAMTKNASTIFFGGYDPNDPSSGKWQIHAMPLAGGTPTLFATDMLLDAIVADDTTLFAYSNTLGFAAFPVGGGPPVPTHVDTIADFALLDEGFIYWVTDTDFGATVSRVCR